MGKAPSASTVILCPFNAFQTQEPQLPGQGLTKTGNSTWHLSWVTPHIIIHKTGIMFFSEAVFRMNAIIIQGKDF
jgi:hypothetical protein